MYRSNLNFSLGRADVGSAPVTTASVALAGLLTAQLFTSADPIGKCYVFWKQLLNHEKRLSSAGSVNESIDEYSKLHRESDVEDRNSKYKALVNAYYDLATVFYEWGWGSCFHFSYQWPKESFDEATKRHEYTLAAQLQVYGKDKHVVDVGCGIGGPMRNISKFLQCQVTGITLNPYQVQRGNELTQADPGCRHSCKSVQGDFMHMPFAKDGEDLFDAAYAIEATCHAPDRVACYKEVYRCLKPGAVFACYEWCMTDKYDASNPEHQRMKKDIEEGNGLPDICSTDDCLEAMKSAGFEVLEESDLALVEPDIVQPWTRPLEPSWNLLSQRFQFNWLGAIITNCSVYALECLRIAPAGTVKTQKVLQAGGFALRDAGQEGIFTAMYLMVGRKPN